MKACSYCGKQFSDDMEACPFDQQPLKGVVETPPEVVPPEATCPQCGAAGDFTPVIELRSSFSLPVFLFGGLFAVLFRNAGRPRRVRCNKCEARFSVSSSLSKISRAIFWLLVTPSIILLSIALIMIIRAFFSR